MWHILLNYLLKLINVSLSPRSTIRMALLGKSNSLTSSKLEWPSFSATKSGVSLPPKVSLAILPSVASYIISIMSVTCIKSVPITTNVVSSNPVYGKVYSMQHHVIKFVSDLQEVGGFLRVPRFPLSIKLTATI